MTDTIRVYLDACCVCRVFDDRSELRVRREAEAIESLFVIFAAQRAVWVVSEALIEELRGNPDEVRREASLKSLALSSQTAPIDATTMRRALRLEAAGYGVYDALHLACAERVTAKVLLTTDDKFEKRARKGLGNPLVAAQNPLKWRMTAQAAAMRKDS